MLHVFLKLIYVVPPSLFFQWTCKGNSKKGLLYQARHVLISHCGNSTLFFFFEGEEHSLKISASQVPVPVCFLWSRKQTNFWPSSSLVTAQVANELQEKVLQKNIVWDSASLCFWRPLHCLFHLTDTRQLSKWFSSASPGNLEGLAEAFIVSKVKVEWSHIYGMRTPHKYPLTDIRAPGVPGPYPSRAIELRPRHGQRALGRRGVAVPWAPHTSCAQKKPSSKYSISNGHCKASFAREIRLLKIVKS